MEALEVLGGAAGAAPELVVLGLGLPRMDGFEVLAVLRGWSHVPVVVLSAHGQEEEKVRGLDLGADDYLTKPFGVPELLARVRAALRRASIPAAEPAGPFVSGGFTMDFVHRRVVVRRLRRKIEADPTEPRYFLTEPGVGYRFAPAAPPA